MSNQTGPHGGAAFWQAEERHFIQICVEEFMLDWTNLHDLFGRRFGQQLQAAGRTKYKASGLRDEWTSRLKRSKAHKKWSYICQVVDPHGNITPPAYDSATLTMRDGLRDDIVALAAQVGGNNWLLTNDVGNLARPIVSITLTPAAGSLAALAVTRALQIAQPAVAGVVHGPPITQQLLPAAPSGPAPPTVAPPATPAVQPSNEEVELLRRLDGESFGDWLKRILNDGRIGEDTLVMELLVGRISQE